jgi:hypothetical protein
MEGHNMNQPRKVAWRRCFILLLAMSGNSQSQVFDEVETGNTCSFFGEAIPAKVTTFGSDKEAEDVIKRIVEASGLVQNFIVRAAGVPNAAAIIQGDTRLILYNQFFMHDTRQRTSSNWAPISIMAHEVGHHLNGHTLKSDGSRPKIELEADYYSGFILQRMGSNLNDARTAMESLGSPTASSSHPAKHDRLAAIASGWTKACEADPRCGRRDEAVTEPVQPGTIEPATRRDGDERRREREKAKAPDSCEYANDGTCDEPDLCEPGTDTSDCRASRRSPRSNRNQPQRPLYCCDVFGRKWCQIAVNPAPPGTPCWCAGVPGSGLICY